MAKQSCIISLNINKFMKLKNKTKIKCFVKSTVFYDKLLSFLRKKKAVSVWYLLNVW